MNRRSMALYVVDNCPGVASICRAEFQAALVNIKASQAEAFNLAQFRLSPILSGCGSDSQHPDN